MMLDYEIPMTARYMLGFGCVMFALGLFGWPAVWRLVFPAESMLATVTETAKALRDELADSQATVERLEDTIDQLITDPKFFARFRAGGLVDGQLTLAQRYRIDLEA